MFNQTILLSHGYSVPPHVDKAPFLLFDWRFPQFVTTPLSVCTRNRAYIERVLTAQAVTPTNYTMGREISGMDAVYMGQIPLWEWWRANEKDTAVPVLAPTPTPSTIMNNHSYLPLIFKPAGFSPNLEAVFVGWSLPGPNGVWSVCPVAELIIGPVPTLADDQLTLTIWARGHGIQPVTVAINGEPIGQVTFTDSVTAEHLSFSADLLHTHQNNHISLHIPHAASSTSVPFPDRQPPDRRLLGIYLEKWLINE